MVWVRDSVKCSGISLEMGVVQEVVARLCQGTECRDWTISGRWVAHEIQYQMASTRYTLEKDM